MNLTFKYNIEPLKEIHRSFYTKTKPYMSYNDAVGLFTLKRLKGYLTYKEVTMCYGLAKMTLDRDFQAEPGYKKLEFVEFLDMIGRVANEKFKTGPQL